VWKLEIAVAEKLKKGKIKLIKLYFIQSTDMDVSCWETICQSSIFLALQNSGFIKPFAFIGLPFAVGRVHNFRRKM
jgi:hypothetical protein